MQNDIKNCSVRLSKTGANRTSCTPLNTPLSVLYGFWKYTTFCIKPRLASHIQAMSTFWSSRICRKFRNFVSFIIDHTFQHRITDFPDDPFNASFLHNKGHFSWSWSNVIKNWERIRGSNANNLIIDSYNALREELPWVVKVKEYLATNDLDNLPPNANGKPFIYKKLFDILSEKFQVDALSCINNPEHKLRTYALIKTVIRLGNYLNVIKNVSIRTQFS